MFLLVALPVSAQYDTPSTSTAILVDKLVGVPHSTKGGTTDYTYVDNLTSGDYRFNPEAYVFFRIRVKNTSNTQLDNVVVSDFGPQYVQMFSDPGTVDGNTLSINVGTLKAQEEKVYVVKGRVTQQSQMPADQGVICVTNKAHAASGSVTDDDTAQFCIEKSVTTTKGGVPATVPQAGAADGILITTMASAMAYLGLKFKKLGQINS
jgi:uncharacterized repeat protein (TIGR01451 family)